MDAEQLKQAQAPLKVQYRENPESARGTLSVKGRIDTGRPAVHVTTHLGELVTGMHPAAGGTGKDACPGEMMLEALVGCAGITFKALAIAMGISIREATVIAEGDLDFRGALGVSKNIPAGLSAIRLRFDVDADASPQQLENLISLAERYCVVYQTLLAPPKIEVALSVQSTTPA